MTKKTLLVVSLMICLMAPLVAWANCAHETVGVSASTSGLQGNLFPSTLDLFIAEAYGNGCETVQPQCVQDCCNAFFECIAPCGQFELQCKLACFAQDDACVQACL